MIFKTDIDKHGTIKGLWGIEGTGIITGYHEDEFDERFNVFSFATVGGVYELIAFEWNFAPTVYPFEEGWYEDSDEPVSKGFAPYYITGDQTGYYFFPRGKENNGQVVFDLEVHKRLAERLVPLKRG